VPKWLRDILSWFGYEEEEKAEEKEPVVEPEKEDPVEARKWSLKGRKSILIKPHAHGSGNLVILLPASIPLDDILYVSIGDEKAWKVYKTTDPEKITLNADGTKSGPNENATHCRFKKPGEVYGERKVLVFMKDGSFKSGTYDMGVKRSYNFPRR